MEILNCRVDDATLHAWKRHFAPVVQPFFVRRKLPLPASVDARWRDRGEVRTALGLSQHDTFATYEVASTARHVLLLDEHTFSTLPPDVRAELLQEQLAVRRGSVFRLERCAGLLERSEMAAVAAAAADGLFVWWPALFAALSRASQARVLAWFVRDDRPPCRRRELTVAQREGIDRALPGVRARVGTFPADSGRNCFGAIIEAFTGHLIAGRTERETFATWLDQCQPRRGEATALGAILLWIDDRYMLQHVAVSLGDGYVFHKEAQTWWSPWQVVRLPEAIGRWQDVGVMSAVTLANVITVTP